MFDYAHHNLRARDHLQTEWWYYHGHLQGAGRRFGFHLVFFRRRTDSFRIGRVLSVRPISKHIRSGHFALTDITTGVFRYDHRRSLVGNAGAQSDCYRVWMRDWVVGQTAGGHELHATLPGVALDLHLQPAKPLVCHRRHDSPDAPHGNERTHVSFTRMHAAGQLLIDDKPLTVTGEAWMDREFGHFSLWPQGCGWDWFGIQLDDERELMIYYVRDAMSRPSSAAIAVLVQPDGGLQFLPAGQIQMIPTAHTISPLTGITYPLGWRLCCSGVGMDLAVEPFLRCHEVDARGSTYMIYWEGPVRVEGTLEDRPVRGCGYVEVVGRRSPRRMLGLYDFGHENLGMLDVLAFEHRVTWWGTHVVRSNRGWVLT